MDSTNKKSLRDNGSFPLVSCIMPTYNRRHYVPKAIEYFMRQDYTNRELIIVDDGTDSSEELVPQCDHIRYIRLTKKQTIGSKRNLACKEARGGIIVHWDDDDWMASWRLSYQVKCLLTEKADICGLEKLLFYDPEKKQVWQYVYPKQCKQWLAGGTLCYTKSFWYKNQFPHVDEGEDTRFVWSNQSKKMLSLQDNTFYVALIHPNNTSPKRTTDSRFQSQPLDLFINLVGKDWPYYNVLNSSNYNHPHSI